MKFFRKSLFLRAMKLKQLANIEQNHKTTAENRIFLDEIYARCFCFSLHYLEVNGEIGDAVVPHKTVSPNLTAFLL